MCAKTQSDQQTYPSPAERAAFLLLDYESALAALEREDPVAVALATEYILHYSERAALELKEGRDYMNLLAAPEGAPAIERIAMEVVLDAIEDEVNEELEDGDSHDRSDAHGG